MKPMNAILRHGLSSMVFLGLASIAHANQSPLAIGATAPMAKVVMKNAVDGKEVTIAKQAGKNGTLVVFTCNHCPWAKKWVDRIVELGNTYQEKGIGVLLINSNDPSVNKSDSLEGTAEEAKQRGMKFPYVIDSTSGIAKAFGASKTPEAFLFDKDGQLVYHGTIDDNADDSAKVTKPFLKDALVAVANGKFPAVKETKSLGCGIKFR
jgi:peroxiredoxin